MFYRVIIRRMGENFTWWSVCQTRDAPSRHLRPGNHIHVQIHERSLLSLILVVCFWMCDVTWAERMLGVGNSMPRVEFFHSKEEHYQWLADTNHWTSAVNMTSDQIPHLWASVQVIAELSQESNNGILNYISTDNVACDMLQITEAAGQSKLQYFGIL